MRTSESYMAHCLAWTGSSTLAATWRRTISEQMLIMNFLSVNCHLSDSINLSNKHQPCSVFNFNKDFGEFGNSCNTVDPELFKKTRGLLQVFLFHPHSNGSPVCLLHLHVQTLGPFRVSYTAHLLEKLCVESCSTCARRFIRRKWNTRWLFTLMKEMVRIIYIFFRVIKQRSSPKNHKLDC